jgi:hypothetical protein
VSITTTFRFPIEEKFYKTGRAVLR